MKILVAPLAARDMREAYDFIARDSREAADRVLARIVESFGLLASLAALGREVRLRGGRKVRCWTTPPFRIYYRVRGKVLQIVRVYHLARRSIEEQD